MVGQPSVSIVMPVRNEGHWIQRSLRSVLNQDYASDNLEILVADGMSTDDTREKVRAMQRIHKNLHLVDNPGKIVPTGLNEAIRQSTGDIVVRVDGHTEIAPNYVRECVEEILRTGADNVGGRMLAVGEGTFGAVVALATSSPFGVGGARFHYSDREEWVDTVYMGAWRREVFDRIGLFDEEMVRSQDAEFNYRLRSKGGRVLLSPRIRSKYYTRSTFGSLWKQYFQYGFWKSRILQKHPRQMRARQFAAPSFVLALTLSAAFAPFGRLPRWMLALVSGSYVAATLGASAWTGRRGGWKHLVLLPGAFGTLHLSYGFGFLFGLIRFAPKWQSRDGYLRWRRPCPTRPE